MRPNKPARLWILLVVAIVGLVICVPQYTRADGAPIAPYGYTADIIMPGQKAIIVYDAETGREDLILSVQLLGDVPEAAWVVPVPAPPEVETASEEWFERLSALTQPEVRSRYRLSPVMCGGVASDSSGLGTTVELLSREQVGAYDVSILSSTDPTALLEWLNEHGYEFPAEGESILEAYIAEGWYFMATRVVSGETARLENDVQPLWLSFETEQPVYPMRLTSLIDESMDVLIYVLSDHRMQVDAVHRFMVEFAGELALQPVASESADLTDLMTGRTYYVTKLRSPYYAPWEAEDDIYFQRASTDEPYRRVIYQNNNIGCCCPSLAPLGVVIGLALVRRRPII